MEVSKTDLKGVLLIKPVVFTDKRGEFVETYNEKAYAENGISVKFLQDDISVSVKGVLRGIHGDDRTWKLLSCLHGSIYFVVVNCDMASANFGRWQSFDIADKNRFQVLVPPKYGNAYVALSETVIFHYKQSAYYDPVGQFTYKWDDPRFGIKWPGKNPILSERDRLGRYA